MEMNMKEWVTHVEQSEARLAIPLMTHPGIDLIGKNVFDAVTNGRTHFEAIAALNKKYPAAASTIIMDLTVEAEAFGSKIHPDVTHLPVFLMLIFMRFTMRLHFLTKNPCT
jgi:uroporphyrinogen decarboxylase